MNTNKTTSTAYAPRREYVARRRRPVFNNPIPSQYKNEAPASPAPRASRTARRRIIAITVCHTGRRISSKSIQKGAVFMGTMDRLLVDSGNEYIADERRQIYEFHKMLSQRISRLSPDARALFDKFVSELEDEAAAE